MKVNMSEHSRKNSKITRRGNLLSYAIINTITKLPKYKEKIMNDKTDYKNMNIILSIEGIEVDIIKFFDKLEESIIKMIKDEAIKLVETEFYDKISLMQITIDDIIHKLRKDLGLPPEIE